MNSGYHVHHRSTEYVKMRKKQQAEHKKKGLRKKLVSTTKKGA